MSTKTSTKPLTKAHLEAISRALRGSAGKTPSIYQELMETKLAKIYGLPESGGFYRIVQDPVCATNPKLSQRLLLQWYTKE